jgi:hypothetical protein
MMMVVVVVVVVVVVPHLRPFTEYVVCTPQPQCSNHPKINLFTMMQILSRPFEGLAHARVRLSSRRPRKEMTDKRTVCIELRYEDARPEPHKWWPCPCEVQLTQPEQVRKSTVGVGRCHRLLCPLPHTEACVTPRGSCLALPAVVSGLPKRTGRSIERDKRCRLASCRCPRVGTVWVRAYTSVLKQLSLFDCVLSHLPTPTLLSWP